MLFISDNKKIDSIVKKLQPCIRLKVSVERDFDCGLNDVFEKSHDVVFIQNQIAGVTGESVARHVKLLLVGRAPKFIFLHDGDAKVKPIKGLIEQVIDLSLAEEAVVADILEKLTIVLGFEWQDIFTHSIPQGGDFVAFMPPVEASGESSQPDSFGDTPETEAAAPVLNADQFPESFSGTDFDESFAGTTAFDIQRADAISEELMAMDVEKIALILDGDDQTEERIPPAEPIFTTADNDSYIDDLSASLSGISTAAASNKAITDTVAVPVSSPLAVDEFTPKPQLMPESAPPPNIDKPHSPPELPSDNGGGTAADSLQTPPQGVQWAFEGEPTLKKRSWKWYQVVELLLVISLLAGGWYFVSQKTHPPQSAVEDAKLPVTPAKPPVGQKTVQAHQSESAALPSFIPSVGLDPAFSTQNPGWERYVGEAVEFRLFRENGKLRAVQVKANDGNIIADTLLQEILVELIGSGEYSVTSTEEKLGFQLSHAAVKGKAELLIYRKKSAIHAAVVSLD